MDPGKTARTITFLLDPNTFVLRASRDSSCKIIGLSITSTISVNYCRIYASVREENPPAVASELSPVHTIKSYGNLLNQQHAIALC